MCAKMKVPENVEIGMNEFECKMLYLLKKVIELDGDDLWISKRRISQNRFSDLTSHFNSLFLHWDRSRGRGRSFWRLFL